MLKENIYVILVTQMINSFQMNVDTNDMEELNALVEQTEQDKDNINQWS